MNQLIKQIAALTVESVIKTHSLLDQVISIASNMFSDNEIMLNQRTMIFTFSIGNYNVNIITVLNTKSVTVRVVDNNENAVAECIVDIYGKFNESYTRISDVDIKNKLVEWFMHISQIDIHTLSKEIEDSSDRAESDNVPDDNIEEQTETVEAEVLEN